MDPVVISAIVTGVFALVGILLTQRLSNSKRAEKPKSGDQLVRDGNTHYLADRFGDAADCFKGALSSDVRSFSLESVHVSLGNCYRELGEHSKAIAQFHTALSLNGSYSQAHVGLGITQRILGRHDEAIEHYQKAAALNPNDSDLYQSLGVLHIFREEPKLALEAFDKAINISPQKGSAFGNQALAYAMLGDFEKADESIRKAILFGHKYDAEIKRRIELLRGNS